MPRGNDGSYTLPSGSLVTVGETIAPSQHNPPLQDLADSMTGSLSRNGKGGMLANLPMGGFRITNMAPGIQPTDAATVGQLTGIAGVPVGFVGDWPSATPPTGWLVCAGQALSRTDYADLFAVVGTTFGAPSGSTFNLPDLRGRVTAGRDIDQGGYADRLTTPNSRTLGATGGTQTVTLTEAQMPEHTHDVTGSTNSAGAHTHSFAGSNTNATDGPSSRYGGSNDGNLFTGSSGAHSHTIAVEAADAGGGEAHPNVQPTIIMTKIIKASNS